MISTDELNLQEEFYEYLQTLKDIAPVLHSSPRVLHSEANFEMAWYGAKNYAYLVYSSLDLVPGNEFKWSEQPHIKVEFEFDSVWVRVTVHCKYEKEKFVPLTRFIEDNELTLLVPTEATESDVEEAHVKILKGMTGSERVKIDIFQVDGMFLYDMDKVKQFAMELDNQLHTYVLEEN